jgi:NAD(P)-dependent dehydrogenase (short-subunit alcohol dehydrogenase family)
MKVVVITGVSRGIGRATAEKFLSVGWHVIGTSISGESNISNERLTVIKLDLSKQRVIEKALEKIKTETKKIDVLINNAGVALDSWDEGVNLSKVRETFEVNLFGLIDFTEKLLPIINEGGSIINLGSRYGSFSMPIDDNTSIGYRMSKASLNMYSRFLAFRLIENKITVSSIDPGWVKTDMGFSGATKKAGPDREPSESAEEIFNLATANYKTGLFWHKNNIRDW